MIDPAAYPLPLSSYPVTPGASVMDVLAARLTQVPFNGVATVIFAAAVLHTFLAKRFATWAHQAQHAHDERRDAAGLPLQPCIQAGLLHFLGEIEVIFGLWVVVLIAAMSLAFGWPSAKAYVSDQVDYTEAVFVVVIMAMAASGPVIGFAERMMRRLAAVGRATPAAWWVTILTLGPILGSFITEPAAMTISAVLLGRQFYEAGPSTRLRYATLGLLFVNISIGGTLTHFAAPPVLMVARPWGWSMAHMASTFGWKAVIAILISNVVYYAAFRRELAALRSPHVASAAGEAMTVPAWITVVHLAFVAFVVAESHYPVLFVGAFLFFLGFVEATSPHQSSIDLKPPLLVGFFLAGLVTHGGLQGWWIGPVLGTLSATPLFGTAVLLTAFNDNALITYLATLVPNLDVALRYSVVAGAVVGGGLTVIANAPNPAGQALLARHFDNGVSPMGLLAGAIGPTLIAAACFLAL